MSYVDPEGLNLVTVLGEGVIDFTVQLASNGWGIRHVDFRQAALAAVMATVTSGASTFPRIAKDAQQLALQLKKPTDGNG